VTEREGVVAVGLGRVIERSVRRKEEESSISGKLLSSPKRILIARKA
jgi:hypothetical protein